MNDFPELDEKDLKRFILALSVVILLIFGVVLPWFFGSIFPVWPWLLAVGLILLGYLVPGSRRPVYITWMKFGLLLNKIMTPLVLGIVYCCLIIPMGFLLRITGEISMHRGADENVTTYRKVSKSQARLKLEKPF